MWVAVEIATLTTVLMVGINRTHAALEAAWKYFILGSVGIAFALFGTNPWSTWRRARWSAKAGRHDLDTADRNTPGISTRPFSTSPFVFCFSATSTKVAWPPLPCLAARRARPRVRRRSRPCCRACS